MCRRLLDVVLLNVMRDLLMMFRKVTIAVCEVVMRLVVDIRPRCGLLDHVDILLLVILAVRLLDNVVLAVLVRKFVGGVVEFWMEMVTVHPADQKILWNADLIEGTSINYVT